MIIFTHLMIYVYNRVTSYNYFLFKECLMPTSVPLEKLTAAANEIDLFKQSYPDAFKAVVNLFRKQRSVGYRNLCRLIMEETTPEELTS